MISQIAREEKGSSLGPMPIGLKLSSIGSITVQSTLKSVRITLISVLFSLISVRTDLEVDRTVMEPIRPKRLPISLWSTNYITVASIFFLVYYSFN